MKIFQKKTYRFTVAKVATAVILLTILASSCKKDFLIEAPELELPQEEAFATPQRVDKIITGLYWSAKNGLLFGGRYHVYNDIRAEEFILRDPNVVTGADVYQATNDATSSQVSNFWSVGYLTINRANLAIDGLTKNVAGLAPTVIEPALGEAKFIRALVYFQLVQIFAKPYVLNGGTSRGLPLRLVPETTLANNALASSTVAQVYAQILKDLNEAEAQLPATYADALTKTTRAHKNTAIALKTRVYLAMANHAKVIEEGNKIVPQTGPFVTTVGAGHSLAPNVASLYVNYTESESIFSFPMAATNAPGTQNQLAFYYNSFSGANLVYPLNKNAPGIYADPIWPATDARKTALTALFTGSGLTAQPVLKKYNTPSPWTDYVPMIRYAEVLLNVAEAEAAPGGNAVRARALLDAVRKRSDPTYDFGVLVAGTQLTETILKERRIELLGEGQRYNDLARLNRPLPAIGAAGQIIPVNDPRYTFPIPINERNTNPLVGE